MNERYSRERRRSNERMKKYPDELMCSDARYMTQRGGVTNSKRERRGVEPRSSQSNTRDSDSRAGRRGHWVRATWHQAMRGQGCCSCFCSMQCNSTQLNSFCFFPFAVLCLAWLGLAWMMPRLLLVLGLFGCGDDGIAMLRCFVMLWCCAMLCWYCRFFCCDVL